MSNNMDEADMTPNATRTLVPELRFPEFRDAGEWGTKELSELAVIINQKAGSNKYTLMSITSGIGLVSQLEKFGREIAGAQYKNYIVIRKNDFAYNKSATKEYPEGFIALYSGETPAAVPNSIFTCFRVDEYKVLPEYLSYLFLGNLHGRWLKNFITVGARAHGSLNIFNDDLLALPVPLPTGYSSQAEQQKIADCLSSIDELISLEARKIDALKAHKKGLMQQLFPAEGETLPKLRFPEFRDAGEWEGKKLSSMVNLISGLHLSPEGYSEVGDVPYFTGPSDFTNRTQEVSKRTGESTSIANKNDTLITVKGSGVGEIWYLTLPAVAMGRQLMAVRTINGSSSFMFQFLLTKRPRFEDLASGNLIPGLSRGDILDLEARFPSLLEQQKIANCLSSIDDLITLEAQKLDALKAHKKGLLQQLFPSLDERPLHHTQFQKETEAAGA